MSPTSDLRLPTSEEEYPFDDAPPFDASPNSEEEYPFDDTPPFETSPNSESRTPNSPVGEFKGFGSEGSSSSFAALFNSADDDADDGEAFDFDAFMKKHEGNHKKNEDEQAQPREVYENKYETSFEESIPESSAAGSIDKGTWGKIVYETEHLFPPLIGQLTGSVARIEGATIYITLGEKNLRVFVNEQMLGRFVSQAAGKILGKEYKIKLD